MAPNQLAGSVGELARQMHWRLVFVIRLRHAGEPGRTLARLRPHSGLCMAEWIAIASG